VAVACGSPALLEPSRELQALGRLLTFQPPSRTSSSTRGSWRRTPTRSGTSAWRCRRWWVWVPPWPPTHPYAHPTHRSTPCLFSQFPSMCEKMRIRVTDWW